MHQGKPCQPIQVIFSNLEIPHINLFASLYIEKVNKQFFLNNPCLRKGLEKVSLAINLPKLVLPRIVLLFSIIFT